MSIWDERFAGEDFVYGIAPNSWLEQQASRIPARGRVLSLGEGEGRNAVWLAKRGFAVDAVDGSAVGLAKARRLAEREGVSIATTVGDLATYQPASAAYDAVVLVFVHLPPKLRALVHGRAQSALKPGGLVIVEAFTPRQLPRGSGGPKQAEMLYEPAALQADFPSLVWEPLEEVETDLDEGTLHKGVASVVRGVGRLPGKLELRECF